MDNVDVLIIDNYDSFTYNLYQAFVVLTPHVTVIRNDAISVKQIRKLNPKSIVLSPGPGHPSSAGICIDIIQQIGQYTPILGVCLGHQAIGFAFGAMVVQAKEQLHGKDSLIFHNRSALYKNMHLPFVAGRYHSLIVSNFNLPTDLIIDAQDTAGNIMGLSHRAYPIYGVQFHPESILTPEGNQLIKNFLGLAHVKIIY